MTPLLRLKIENTLMHGIFFMLIFGLGYWIWPLENKSSTDYGIYLAALIFGTILFNFWKRSWMNRMYDQQNKNK